MEYEHPRQMNREHNEILDSVERNNGDCQKGKDLLVMGVGGVGGRQGNMISWVGCVW